MTTKSTQVQTGTGPGDSARTGSNGSCAPNAFTSISIAPRTRDPARSPVTVMPGPLATTKGIRRTPTFPIASTAWMRKTCSPSASCVVSRWKPRRRLVRRDRIARVVKEEADRNRFVLRGPLFHHRSGLRIMYFGWRGSRSPGRTVQYAAATIVAAVAIAPDRDDDPAQGSVHFRRPSAQRHLLERFEVRDEIAGLLGCHDHPAARPKSGR